MGEIHMPANYIATGPAPAGFLTAPAASIVRGAEVTGSIAGALGIGPTGVIGQSNGLGRGDVIAPGVGVLGLGDGGPGGKFSTAGVLDPQLNLVPHPLAPALPLVPVQPTEFVNKVALPKEGTAGDFYARMYELPEAADLTRCALWFCVASATPTQGAIWCQVLLGTPNEGSVV
jgi:hypothetical protein